MSVSIKNKKIKIHKRYIFLEKTTLTVEYCTCFLSFKSHLVPTMISLDLGFIFRYDPMSLIKKSSSLNVFFFINELINCFMLYLRHLKNYLLHL